MNVIVQSKTFIVTEAIRAFVTKHLGRAFRRRGRISQIFVFLENIPKKKNDLFSASAKIYVDMPGKNVVAQEKAEDMYVAITQAAHTAARQIRKLKEKRQKRAPRWAFAETVSE
jgi:ribosomal subunit interface protein